jgi:hypothetical protein
MTKRCLEFPNDRCLSPTILWHETLAILEANERAVAAEWVATFGRGAMAMWDGPRPRQQTIRVAAPKRFTVR